MTLLPLVAHLLVMMAGQQTTIDRPRCCSDDRVIVVTADRNVAVGLGGFMNRGDGAIRARTYKVFRDGLPETAWTTPAYKVGALDILCEEQTVRIVFERLYRGNGDPIEIVQLGVGRHAPFMPPSNEAVREQVKVACGADARISYEHWGAFVSAYGLNDGRTPTVGPGQMVP